MAQNNPGPSQQRDIALPDRSDFSAPDTVKLIWTQLGLPEDALKSLTLEDGPVYYQSSFKISHLAQSAIALSALGAALIHSLKTGSRVPKVFIPLRHACLEFQTERLFTIDGHSLPSTWGPIGGLHSCLDGHVRIHDGFSNHRNGTLKLLGLSRDASRADVADAVSKWKKLDFEEAAHRNKLAVFALRSYQEWDALDQAPAVPELPVKVRKINGDGPACLPPTLKLVGDKCLRGLRVLEFSRVIAGPVCGKTLAVHGADVLWVTSSNLPDLPSLDKNLARGKRSIQLDLDQPKDRATLIELIKGCDIFLQGYRPHSLEARGFGPADIAALRPGVIYANMSAFGPDGPWSGRRGFDSLVQTCTGMNVSEAEHRGQAEIARPTPVQALDHGGGFLLATGIFAALYKRATQGGSWEVHVSLAGVMKYLRSLGQWHGKSGFHHADPADPPEDVPESFFETKTSDFGVVRGLKHAAVVEGSQPTFDFASCTLGSSEAKWL